MDTAPPVFDPNLDPEPIGQPIGPTRPGWVHILAWGLFFLTWCFLSIAPVLAPLLEGETAVIPPGMLNDPIVVVGAIVMGWVSFTIAILLSWKAGLSFRDLGIKKLPLPRLFAWSLLTLVAVFGFWFAVNLILGDRLEIIEPLTRRPSGVYHWTLWMVLALTAGISEEFVMRGYGIGFLTRLGINKWIGAVVISVIFGSLHLYEGSSAIFVIGVWGFLFAIPFLKTGSLLPGIIAHTAIDAVAPFFIQ